MVLIQVVLVVFAIVGLVASGVLGKKSDDVKNDIKFGFSLVIGFLSVGVLAFSPIWNSSGLPIRDIYPGTYKVGFVYVAGENVNVAIEWNNEEKIPERIYYYQFKKDAFEGTLNPNSKKLVVVQSGSFKKLRLE